jgi:hypothetical protein
LVKYEALVANGASERLPASEAELASRFGMDTGMLVAIGGWRALLNVLPAKDAQHWEAIVPRAEEPIWASREDPALRSWFRDAYLTHPGTGYQRPEVLGVLDTKPMAICVAGNASGKTTLKWNLPVGSVFDLDEAFRASGYLAVLKQTPNLRTGALPSEVVRFLADACATNGCSFLMSQYPARWMAQVVAAMHRTIEIVYLVHTGVRRCGPGPLTPEPGILISVPGVMTVLWSSFPSGPALRMPVRYRCRRCRVSRKPGSTMWPG